MKVALCTLVLNEMEWLPKLYEQHKDWPSLVGWCFVEAADQQYAKANPGMVTAKGLSTDGTTEFLCGLENRDAKVLHVRHGFAGHDDPAQGKVMARNRYLEICDAWSPDVVVVLDADEFYPREDQEAVNSLVTQNPTWTGFCLPHREVWRPPSQAVGPLFAREVRGGFWGIPYCRVWPFVRGMRYFDNHNTPAEPFRGRWRPLDRNLWRGEKILAGTPQMVHLGFAASLRSRQAKHRYYEARGEGRTDRRGWYVDSRRAWETWAPGDALPRGAEVVPWVGPVPECFLGEG